MNEIPEYDQFVRKNYRFNFTVNLLDGANFWFAQSFIASGVILPLYVLHYTDNKLLIGWVAVLSTGGYFLPQLLTSNWVENSPLKKKFPVNIGLIAERLPLFLLAPATMVFAKSSPILVLLVFFSLLAWTNIGAGLVSVGWQDMIGKVIPLERRGIFFGLTNALGTGAGVLGSIGAVWSLGRFPFPIGYVICFGLAGLFNAFSWFFISLTREYPVENGSKSVSQQEYWKRLPSVLKKDRNFLHFLISQATINLGGMAWGFVAVFAIQHWGQSEATVSSYNISMLLGQALSNPLFGILADRHGFKVVVQLCTLSGLLSIFLTLIIPSANWFYIIFFLRGISLAGVILVMMFALEFSSTDIRPTYIGINNTSSGIIAWISPLIGGWLVELFGFSFLFWISLCITFIGLVMITFRVRDPRHIKNNIPISSPAQSLQTEQDHVQF